MTESREYSPSAAAAASAPRIQLPNFAARDTLREVLERGALRVAVEWMPPPEVAGDPPEFYLDPATGKPAGIAITLSEIMAADLRVRPEYVNVPWQDQIGALHRGEVDLLPKHTNIPERGVVVDFAEPLIPFEVVCIVRDDTGFRTVEDVNRDGVVIATWPGSSCQRVIDERFPNVTVLGTTSWRSALREGKAHAAVMDIVTKISMSMYPEQRALTGPDGKVIVFAREFAAPAVYPGDFRFLNWINNWIRYHRALGTIDRWCGGWWKSWLVE
jgi:ABC-type amino acid transport substrate-binding protein